MNFEALWSNFEGLLRDFEGASRSKKTGITLRDHLKKSTSMRL
jgi:hypothetical protein